MRKVRYKGLGFNIKPGLTNYNVYDVVKHIHSEYGVFWDKLILINDYGEEASYDVYDQCDYSNCRKFLEDVTHEYRNVVIDEIML